MQVMNTPAARMSSVLNTFSRVEINRVWSQILPIVSRIGYALLYCIVISVLITSTDRAPNLRNPTISAVVDRVQCLLHRIQLKPFSFSTSRVPQISSERAETGFAHTCATLMAAKYGLWNYVVSLGTNTVWVGISKIDSWTEQDFILTW